MYIIFPACSSADLPFFAFGIILDYTEKYRFLFLRTGNSLKFADKRERIMPYCPKCDMEFVEGITVCTDCGGPLVDKDVWFAEKEEREAKERMEQEERMRRMQEMEEEAEPDRDKMPEIVTVTRKGARTSNTLFVPARIRAEELRSSGTAFLAVGGGACVAAVLLWTGMVRLPMTGASGVIFRTAITALGVIFLGIGMKSRAAVGETLKEADAEDKRTAEILQWFRDSWTAEALDKKLLSEDPSLEGPDLDFRRNSYITDLLVTGKDIPDQSYADYLADKIFQELYGE